MRAAQVTEIGRPPRAVVVEEPVAAAGQTLVAVRAAALNPVELRVASGQMPGAKPPYVPGLEGVGTVINSARFAAGTRVRFENDLPGFGKDGAIRETAIADDETLVALPDSVGDEPAAAIGVVGITAQLALDLAGMSGGDRVAVLGATGGVGQMAVQLAAARGAAAVVAVGRHRPTLEWLTSNGASALVDLGGGDELSDSIAEAAGGPVDVVVDPLWGRPAMEAILSLADGGRLVTVGQTAGTDVELPLQAMRKARSAVWGLSSGWTPLPEKVDAFDSVMQQVATGRVNVAYEVETLDRVSDAWDRQRRFPHTKLVISFV